MLKKIISILTLFLITVGSIYAQKEQYNWYFGFNARLSWNSTRTLTGTGVYGTANATLTGLPLQFPGSAMQTYEGCFSTSDADGNVLFYSDGITIWNKNNQVMVTGLTGGPSSAQSGIILPYPETPGKYIAVTLDKDNSNNLSYTVVNMSLNGGLGGADPAFTNVSLTGQSGALGESVFAVRHTNKEDFWIVAPGRTTTTSYLNVWKVTSAGVQASRHSVVTVPIGFTSLGANGYLKFTTDGLHYAWADFLTGRLVYGDFNPTTGIITSVKIRDTYTLFPSNPNRAYGVEFSSSGKYLYVTYAPGTINTNQVSGLVVYDFAALLITSTPNSINPVKTIANPLSPADGVTDHFGGVQLGPDGRIYITRFSSTGMFVITNPESPTTMNIYKLLNFLPGNGYWGLPNFAAPWFRMELTPPANAESCANVSATFQLSIIPGMGLSNVSRIVVDFGDGGTTTYNSPLSSLYSFPYTYNKPGIYTITITAYNATGGVEISTSSTMTINSCAMRVNPQVSVRAGT